MNKFFFTNQNSINNSKIQHILHCSTKTSKSPLRPDFKPRKRAMIPELIFICFPIKVNSQRKAAGAIFDDRLHVHKILLSKTRLTGNPVQRKQNMPLPYLLGQLTPAIGFIKISNRDLETQSGRKNWGFSKNKVRSGASFTRGTRAAQQWR